MGSYVDPLNALRERVQWVGGVICLGKGCHCLMRAISQAKGRVKFWYDALDDVVSLLAYFCRTSSKKNVRVVAQRW